LLQDSHWAYDPGALQSAMELSKVRWGAIRVCESDLMKVVCNFLALIFFKNLIVAFRFVVFKIIHSNALTYMYIYKAISGVMVASNFSRYVEFIFEFGTFQILTLHVTYHFVGCPTHNYFPELKPKPNKNKNRLLIDVNRPIASDTLIRSQCDGTCLLTAQHHAPHDLYIYIHTYVLTT
jgi:hypothetical protein